MFNTKHGSVGEAELSACKKCASPYNLLQETLKTYKQNLQTLQVLHEMGYISSDAFTLFPDEEYSLSFLFLKEQCLKCAQGSLSAYHNIN